MNSFLIFLNKFSSLKMLDKMLFKTFPHLSCTAACLFIYVIFPLIYYNLWYNIAAVPLPALLLFVLNKSILVYSKYLYYIMIKSFFSYHIKSISHCIRDKPSPQLYRCLPHSPSPLRCITHMASFRGPVAAAPQEKMGYFRAYLTGVVGLLT